MGNYSGTIRCGHCYQSGHNRAGCEKLTEQYQREWEHCLKNVDPTSYRYTRVRETLAKRTGVDPLTGEATRKRRATYGGRECSYCKDKGHNRRTCEVLKRDKARFTALTAKARQAALESMQQCGFGPGALVMMDQYGEKIACLVTGIDWSSMHENARWPQAVKARKVSNNQVCVIPFPKEVSGSSNTWNSVSIVGPTHKLQPPAGWADAADLDLDSTGIFDKGQQRDYWFWRERENDNA